MSSPTYGLLCPMGHGVLNDRDEWTSKGVAWCPHEEHGGNGRMYRLTEVKTGSYNPNAPKVKSDWQIEQEARRAAVDQTRKEREMAKKDEAVKAAAPKERAPRKAKEPKECKCGCGEMTKGGLFRPGHDARYHSALAKAEAAKAATEAAEAETF